MPPFDNVFYEISALLAVATVGGAFAVVSRQPLIVAFLAVGIVLGPAGLGWVSAADQIDLLARLGIALLLFVVGLKLDLHIIRTIGPVALATGLGQVLFTSVVGFLIALALGMAPVPALYVAVALTFSSTIIIVKLLSDKREVDALHGRIAVGFLIVQDIVVVLVMIGLTALGQAEAGSSLGVEALLVLVKGVGMLAVLAVLMRYVLGPVLERLARIPELLVLFAIAWAVNWATLGDVLGFSKEVGAFLAGISIASTRYRELVAARLVSLRDFLLLFFFIDLGAGLEMSALGAHLGEALVFSVFVLVGNPLIVIAIMGFMGYRKRTGLLAGLTVAQISEFSLILAALGLSLGHIDRDTVGLVTLVGLITISVSTYMILYSQPLYLWLAPWLSVFERHTAHPEAASDQGALGEVEVLVFGLGRFGTGIAGALRERGYRLLAVDFDPEMVHQAAGTDYATHYGDAEDPEFVGTLPLDRVRWIVSTVRDPHINRALLLALRQHHYQGYIAMAAHGEAEARWLREGGADLVLMPYRDAAREAVARLVRADGKPAKPHPVDGPLAEPPPVSGDESFIPWDSDPAL